MPALQKLPLPQLEQLQDAIHENQLKPLPIETVVATYQRLSEEAQRRVSQWMVSELVEAAKFEKGSVIMFDRRKYVRSVEADEDYLTNRHSTQ